MLRLVINQYVYLSYANTCTGSDCESRRNLCMGTCHL